MTLPGASARAALAGVAFVVAACSAPADLPGSRWRFGTPQIVLQRTDGSLRSSWLVTGAGGRTFVLFGETRADGALGVSLVERDGTSWRAPDPWLRPGGASSETLLWVDDRSVPAVLTLADGPVGPVLYVRTFQRNAWSSPEAVTPQGTERPAYGAIASGDGGALHVVYGVPGGSCADGVQLRARVRDAAGWSTSRAVADTCGLDRVVVAVDHAPNDPLLVVWTGPSQGIAIEGETDLLATASASSVGADGGVTSSFVPPYRVVVGDNREAMAVPVAGGRFLASWTLTTTSPASPSTGQRRAAFDTYDRARGVWETADTGWFATNAAPWIAPLPSGGALAFGADGTQPTARLAVREWASASRPVASFDVMANPVGTVSSLRGGLTVDGTVQAVWIETQDGGAQRLTWTVALPVGPSRDAGR